MPHTTAPENPQSARAISAWLFVMCALVALMVIVGGATRLTDSGLSITEWRPVTGAVPPISQADWESEFAKYQQIPEYSIVNQGMSLAEFKEIYWWEWGHRFLGRLIGVAFLLPMLFFLARGMVGRKLGLKLVGLFILGGMQGALGWYMVTSGLADRIDVSQYRLTAHLGLAVLLFALMFWLALSLRSPYRQGAPSSLFWGGIALAAGVYAQMLLGAFVAGLRAGRMYNTWPLMEGRFFPEAYFRDAPRFLDMFEEMAAVQFNHRVGAYLLAAGAFWFYFAARNTAVAGSARLVLVTVALQICLGIWTLLAVTPLALGLAHQAGALLVMAAALNASHSAMTSTSMMSPSSAGA